MALKLKCTNFYLILLGSKDSYSESSLVSYMDVVYEHKVDNFIN